LIWIGVVLRAAKSLNKSPVNPEIVEEARTACRELKLTGKSKRRSRRPTSEELARLDEFFRRRDNRSKIPMQDIMWFAIFSARREAEICRLQWARHAQPFQDQVQRTCRGGRCRRISEGLRVARRRRPPQATQCAVSFRRQESWIKRAMNG
jgi:hypothetical protein